METSVNCQSDKNEIVLRLGDKVRVKKGCGNQNQEGDWQDGEEFIIWKMEVKQWGTFICPNNYQSISISKVELANSERS
jgi:hypothetical protein